MEVRSLHIPALLCGLAVAVVMTGCSGDEGTAIAAGRLGGPCYANLTCNSALVCRQDICVLDETDGDLIDLLDADYADNADDKDIDPLVADEEPDAEQNPDGDIDADPDMDTDPDVDTDPDIDTDPDAVLDPDPEPEAVETDTEVVEKYEEDADIIEEYDEAEPDPEPEAEAEPEPEPEPEMEAEPEAEPELPETPDPGIYVYERLPIGGFTRGEAVEFHPGGDYFVILESYNVVHIVRWSDRRVLRIDLDPPGSDVIAWRDILFDPSGDFAMLLGSRYGDGVYTGVVYRLDDAAWRAWMQDDESTPVIAAYPNATAPAAFVAIKRPWDGGPPVILGKGGSSSNKIAYLYTFDPLAGTVSSPFAARSGGIVGCDGFAFCDNEFGGPGIFIVCGDGGAETMYYTEIGGVGEWRDNPGNNNLGNTSHTAAHTGGDYALVISWSGRAVYRFEAGSLNSYSDAPRFSTLGIWGVTFQQQGQRALIYGRAGGSPLQGTVLEYRHDEYWCNGLTYQCGLTEVSIPNFGAAPWNATSNGYLYDAAFRPGCDGGVMVGHNGDGLGLAAEFQIASARQCR